MSKTLAIFFGGQTVEHDISIITAQQLIENLDETKYDFVPVYISRQGKWFTGEKLTDMEFLRDFNASHKGVEEVMLLNTPPQPALKSIQERNLFSRKNDDYLFDVAVICMHGVNGEDGTIQGMLEMSQVPYTSTGVLASAAGMDKILMKTAFKGAGIPVLDYTWFYRDKWEEDPDKMINEIEQELDYPLFVKPSNLGSSIGIGKACDRDELYGAIEVAIRYDNRILVEKALEDGIEINCSAKGYGNEVDVSPCEQPITWESFLSFDEKYMRSGKNSDSAKLTGMNNMSRVLPADIDDGLRDEIQKITRDIFMLFDAKGVVRVDYLVDFENELLYANEINCIPGSMAYYLWEADGIPYDLLIDDLVKYAYTALKEKQRNIYAYDSDVLKKVNFVGVKSAKVNRQSLKQ